MTNTNFEQELELSWKIPLPDLLELFARGILKKGETLYIQQKWCYKGVSEGVPYSARIRKSSHSPKYLADTSYEYTVKYYFSKTNRMEFNSTISKEEYEKIFAIHPHGKVVNKTRLLFIDKESGNVPLFPSIVFCADFISGSDYVVVEVEFRDQAAKNIFRVPLWLRPYVKEK